VDALWHVTEEPSYLSEGWPHTIRGPHDHRASRAVSSLIHFGLLESAVGTGEPQAGIAARPCAMRAGNPQPSTEIGSRLPRFSQLPNGRNGKLSSVGTGVCGV